MPVTAKKEWIPLTTAAVRLNLRYHRVRDLMLQGRLGEQKQEGTRWFVTEAGVTAYRQSLSKEKE